MAARPPQSAGLVAAISLWPSQQIMVTQTLTMMKKS
jgi:hypothetical protein